MPHGNLWKFADVFKFQFNFLTGFYREFSSVKLHTVIARYGNLLGGVGSNCKD